MAWLKERTESKVTMTSKYILLPDRISKENLSYAASKSGTNLGQFRLETLTEFAHTLLKRTGGGDYDLLEESERDLARALIRSVISASTEPELGFLRQLDIENRDTLKVVRQEFDDYLRATNDTEFHGELENIAKGLKDDFTRSVALSCLTSFKALRSKLGTLTLEQFGDHVLLLRAQLLRVATAAVEISENEMLFDGWEVAVAGIPVLDAAVLRMLVAIGTRRGCTLRIFCASKQHEGLRRRLERAGVQFSDEAEGNMAIDLVPQAKAIRGDESSEKPQLMSAPDRRREILVLAEKISELITRGVHPSEILVVARDSGNYQTLAQSILPAYGIPVHVQTRQLESLLPQTQMISSLLRLFTKVSRAEEIEWNQLTDPIRLGVCLHGKKGWPMEGPYFVRLEEVLARIQRDKDRRGLKLDEWISEATASTTIYDKPKVMVLDFLAWVKQSAAPISSSTNAISILRDVLDAYIYNRAVWVRETIDPRVENPGRFRLSELHPTEHASRIRNSLRDLEKYFDAAEKAQILTSLTWEKVQTAYADVVVSSTFGIPLKDLNTVRFVDAGNTSFLEAKHIFIIGLMADEFPKKHAEGKLLGEELRRAISGSEEAKSGYIYLPSPETDYDTDRDYLTTTLMTAREEIVCSMAYLDESGHQVEWSPFVSHLARDLTPMQPGDWLPTPSTTWKDLVEKQPRWINWRLFSYHQFRKPLADPAKKVTTEDIVQIAEQIDPAYFKDHLGPRIGQYIEPTDTITVRASEKWFSGLSLESLAGPPYATYELDIHATCPFQFYFYQFLYRRKFDDDPKRGVIPYWYWKLPWVPRRLTAVYPSWTTDEAIGKVISLLPSRQKDLSALSTEKSLGELLANHLKNPYEERRVRSSFAAERSLVRQETSEKPPIQRDWEWIKGGQEIKIENSKGSARVVLPPHRLDKLRSSILILAYVGSSRWLPDLLHLNDVRNNQIYDKSIKDPIADYRLAVLVSYYASSPIAGALFVGLYGEDRKGYYNADLISEHKGRNPYPEELQVPLRTTVSARQIFRPEAWERRLEDLRDAVVERVTLMTPSDTITYKATPDRLKCPGCVYYSLCHIPRAKGI